MVPPRRHCKHSVSTQCPEEIQGDIRQHTGRLFVLHKADGNNHVLMPSNNGLFYSDVKKDEAHVLVNTVDKNKNKYTVKHYWNTCKARSIQDIIGRPSTSDYIRYVEDRLIPSCPITNEDIVLAEDLLGTNLSILQGKMTRKTQEWVTLEFLDNLPMELLAEHGYVTIAIDIMIINDIPFMMTTLWAIYFGTAEMIKNETKPTIIKSIQQIINTYHGCSFKIKNILGDWQFSHGATRHKPNITGRDM